MKKFFSEFKTFISKGNVMDLAVGVIVGGAFTAIVTALSDHILKPIINWLLAIITGKSSLSEIYTFLKKVTIPFTDDIDLANSIYIDWGAFINAVINFVLIAFVLFCIVKVINKLNDSAQAYAKASKMVSKKERAEMLKAGKSLADIHALEEERLAEQQRLAAEAAAVPPAPSTNDLLNAILDELKKH